MSDPRITPDPARCKTTTAQQVGVSVVDLCRAPDGARDRQLLFGEAVTVLDQTKGWAYVQAAKDGYCGYVLADQLTAPTKATHRVHAAATHIYPAPDFKSKERMSLSHGSLLEVKGEDKGFARTPFGFVPAQHISSSDTPASDPAEVATCFLGTPYLWGGNSRWGIDCSGLVQAALTACGQTCPGDSDLQMNLGHEVTDGQFTRNDLLFWKGHVALVTDAETLIHANAGSMSTRFENIAAACDRIAAQGGGPIIAHRRLSI